ncbi:hypothetical protein ACVWXP_003815 [Bradyrhizobium sp. USDA 4463]
MKLSGLLIVGSLLAALCASPGNASVVFDAGINPDGFTTGHGPISGNFSKGATAPVYEKFSLTHISDLLAGFATNNIGTLELFSCAGNCTGTSIPTAGTLLASAPVISLISGAGIDKILGAGSYFTEYVYGGLPGTKPSGLFVGDVVVTAVPEPATWAMMLMGFMGVGLVAYRRRVGPSLRLV